MLGGRQGEGEATMVFRARGAQGFQLVHVERVHAPGTARSTCVVS